MDEMIKKSYDEETKDSVIQWGVFIIHVNLGTGKAKYYRDNDKHLDLPDFKMIWDQDRIYQAMCAVKGEKFKVKGEKFKSSSSTNIKPIQKGCKIRDVSSTTDDYKYYFSRNDTREDFLKTNSKEPNCDDTEGVLIRAYFADKTVCICKIRDVRNNDWVSITKGTFEVALNSALEKIGLSRYDLPEEKKNWPRFKVISR